VVEPVPGGWAKTFNRYRSATRMETIPIPDHDGIRRALERKRLLALVADRDLTGRGTLCRAFDAWRSYPNGPAAYALRYNVPIVIGYFVFQDKPGRPPYRAHIESLPYSATGSMDVDVPALTRHIAERLNQMIARFPDQWLVFKAGWVRNR
jgi:KDO2-lipid IV(A) lauroyltransferase